MCKCPRSQGLREHIKDYADTFWKLWRLLTNFKGTITQKKVFGYVYTSNSNNLKIWKPPYLKKNLGVRVVLDYADTGFSNFAIEYLRENEKVRETVFACSYGAQVESFKQKKMVKNLVTLSL